MRVKKALTEYMVIGIRKTTAMLLYKMVFPSNSGINVCFITVLPKKYHTNLSVLGKDFFLTDIL